MPISPAKLNRATVASTEDKITASPQPNKDFHNFKSSLARDEIQTKEIEIVPQTISFESAGGRDISISAEAKKQTAVLKDVDLEQTFDVHSASVGFKSALGKAIAISEKGKDKAKKLFEEMENQTVKSASDDVELINKHVERGRRTSNVAECLNTNDNGNVSETDIPQIVSFQSAGGKGITLSEKATRKAAILMAEINTGCDSTNTEPSFVGFHSAGGKAIPISAEVQRKAGKFFEKVEREAETDSVHAATRFPNYDANANSVDGLNKLTKDYNKVPKGFRPFRPPKMASSLNQSKTKTCSADKTETDRTYEAATTKATTSNFINQKVESQQDEFNDNFYEFTSTQMAEIVDTANVFLQTDDDIAWTQIPSCHILPQEEVSDTEVTFKTKNLPKRRKSTI